MLRAVTGGSSSGIDHAQDMEASERNASRIQAQGMSETSISISYQAEHASEASLAMNLQ